ncbi:MAG: hypothetical protein EOS09_18635 [Mesorhizobium sp.]|nr:MAG: hypothetical protein EOS09_18635 [Mesorhizobium sp.]
MDDSRETSAKNTVGTVSRETIHQGNRLNLRSGPTYGSPSPLVGEGGLAKRGRMRGAPAWHRRHSVQHPSSVSALRANPPSPTRGEKEEGACCS